MKTRAANFLLGLLALVAVSSAHATVIVTYAEDPGAVTSSLINTTTFDFNSLATKKTLTDVTWTGVGTFDKLYVLPADQYGGADNSKYSVQGVGSPVSKTILNLDTASAYFGFWWSAGDSSNLLRFYSGHDGTGTLLAEFSTASLLKALGSTYYGNPVEGSNEGKDAGEPFAFINFFAVDGVAWSSIVLTNSSSSGFESDNYTSRVEAYNPATDGAMPGIVLEALNGTQVVSLVPEPGPTLAMVLLGTVSVGGPLLRRLRRKD